MTGMSPWVACGAHVLVPLSFQNCLFLIPVNFLNIVYPIAIVCESLSGCFLIMLVVAGFRVTCRAMGCPQERPVLPPDDFYVTGSSWAWDNATALA